VGVEITIASNASAPAVPASKWARWGQLVLGIICLVMIANLQYGWTLFIDPIDAKYQWGRAPIQVAFTIFIVTETWVAPIAGYLVDRLGPRVPVLASGVLVAAAWVINAFADSLTLFYIAAIVAGLGAAPIFAATAGNAVKWFPDRRGLATGLTVAGFGAGSALTIVPLAKLIQVSGYEAAFLYFALGQGAVIVLAALKLRAPGASDHAALMAPSAGQSRRDYRPAEVLRAAPFWVMYAMFVMVGTGGLMVTAQLAPLARDFAIDTAPVSTLGLTMPALGFALAVGLVCNGLSRPFFGLLSDYAGRENTMLIAFLLEGIAIFALLWFAANPLLFVLLSGLVYFAWGQIFALFPATCTDIYGKKFATTNYSMLYTAKGTAALLVPLGNVLTAATGGWTAVFMVASALNILAAVLAFAALKPMRTRAILNENSTSPQAASLLPPRA
jgi:OFA family oxalate/formate antiporter-like MFS transporter